MAREDDSRLVSPVVRLQMVHDGLGHVQDDNQATALITRPVPRPCSHPQAVPNNDTLHRPADFETAA